MSKYINSDRLKEKIIKYRKDTDYIRKNKSGKRQVEETAIILDILATLDKMPSADVVEVVRCKDCKHYGMYQCNRKKLVYELGDEVGKFSNIAIACRDYDFCSNGERKENE